jgi:methionine-rich copper-binding protein CopC
VTLSPGDALSGIASTQYRVDGGSFQAGTSVAIPAPADHSNDGVHTIDYRSTDNAGNFESLQTTTVRIDTTLPTGALTAPADGAHVNGNVAVSAGASDAPSGVASVEFLVRPSGSVSFSSISTDTTAPYDASWDSTSAAEGNAELKVVVVDNSGLAVTSAIRTVVVDNPPVPTLDDPGANISGTVTLTASSQPDTTQVVFERSPAGAGTWTPIATDTTAPFSADFDTSAVAEAIYDLRVIATDGGGFNGTSPLQTARVDNTTPSVSVSDPASGAIVGGPNVHLGALATDLGSGVASVRFEQRPTGGGAFTAIGTDTTDPYEASWNTTGLNGNFELRAVATDAAGNPATAAIVPVIVAATAASVTLDDPGALLRGVVSLSATAPSLAVASVSFERRAAGGSWTRIVLDTARPWSGAFDTTSLGDGVYDLRAQALDSSGQLLATHSRDGIRIDNTAPAMLSATPADGSVVSSVTSIALIASEPVASVQGATLDRSGATAQISGSNVTFSTSSLGAGAHALTGSLVDSAGNTGAFSLHFTVEIKAHATLILHVSKPRTQMQSRGSKRVFLVSVSLSTPARVKATLLSPTGKRLRTLRAKLSAGRHSLRFILPTASLPPGRYTILVVATGSDGSKVVKRVYVKIARKQTTVKKRAAKATTSTEVVVPVTPASGPSGGSDSSSTSSTPAAHTSKPEAKKQAPRAKARPLEAASGYVSSKPGRTVGLVIVLLGMGAAIAFLIKIEMGRMLGSPRR